MSRRRQQEGSTGPGSSRGFEALLLAVMHLTPLGFLAYLLFHLWAVLAGIALTVRPREAMFRS